MQIPKNVIRDINRLQHYLAKLYEHDDFAKKIFLATKNRFTHPNTHDVISKVLANAKHAPKPYNQWLTRIANAAWRNMLNTTQAYINHEWHSTIYKNYHQYLSGHYPLNRHSQQDASMAKFQEFFAAQGALFQFYQTYLHPFTKPIKNSQQDGILTIVKPEYSFHWKTLNGLHLSIANSTEKQLQQAFKISQEFFPQYNNDLQLRFSLMATAITPNIAEFTLSIGKQQLRYPNGETSLSEIFWPNKDTHKRNIELRFKKNDGKTATKNFTGPWALFHLLDDALVKPDNDPRRFSVTLQIDDAAVNYQLIAENKANPFALNALDGFALPKKLFSDS